MRIPRSLPALGLSIGASAVALVVLQPSATLAGAATANRQTGSAGRTAAQVGARVLIDNLAVPAPSSRASSAGGNTSVGSVTIALASLHLRSPRPRAVRPRVAAAPVTPAPVTPAPVTPPPAPNVSAPPPAPVAPPAAPPAPVPTGPTSPSPAVWAELRECESGDNYAIDTGNGFYGAYQFAEATWLGLGYSGFPNQAPPAVQDQAAQQLQAMDGWGPWPGCSAKLGL